MLIWRGCAPPLFCTNVHTLREAGSFSPTYAAMDSSSETKQQHTYIENAEIQEITHSKDAQDDSSSSDNLMNAEVRASAEKKLVRKLDMRLISTIILIYIMNYIDVRLVASPVLVYASNETSENSSDYSQVERVGARSWFNRSILIAVKRL